MCGSLSMGQRMVLARTINQGQGGKCTNILKELAKRVLILYLSHAKQALYHLSYITCIASFLMKMSSIVDTMYQDSKIGEARYQSPYLSHAKRALYHMSYIPYLASFLMERSSIGNTMQRGIDPRTSCMQSEHCTIRGTSPILPPFQKVFNHKRNVSRQHNWRSGVSILIPLT